MGSGNDTIKENGECLRAIRLAEHYQRMRPSEDFGMAQPVVISIWSVYSQVYRLIAVDFNLPQANDTNLASVLVKSPLRISSDEMQ